MMRKTQQHTSEQTASFAPAQQQQLIDPQSRRCVCRAVPASPFI